MKDQELINSLKGILQHVQKMNDRVKPKKCIECKHMGQYTTGMDEYPLCTTIVYCKKDHWENGDPNGNWDEDVDCPDYEEKEK